jgi:hypothetical protein
VTVAEVLTFVQRPDGTLVAQAAISTTGGQVVPLAARAAGTPAAVTQAPTVTRQALSFLAFPPGADPVQRLFAPGYTGDTVTAQPKLAQRFVLHLFTVKGSLLYRPNQGCVFVARLQSGQARTEADVFTAFAASLPDLNRNLAAEELNTDPPEERFAGAALAQLTVAKAVLTATFTVANRAGARLNITIPLTFKL